MKEIFIVVRPNMDSDVSLGGTFSNYEAAEKCAEDSDAEYEGYIRKIDLGEVKYNYFSEFEDEDEDED